MVFPPNGLSAALGSLKLIMPSPFLSHLQGALSQITNAASSSSSGELVFWLIEHVLSSNKTSSGMSNLLFDILLPGRSNDTVPGHKCSA